MLQPDLSEGYAALLVQVSNPISGEVGAAAFVDGTPEEEEFVFQTPSAGRWVLQPKKLGLVTIRVLVSNPISGEVGAAA